MSQFWLDTKYLNQLSGRFEGFQKKTQNTWNIRCYACGDSQKSKRKKRGYFYEDSGTLFYKCHNCHICLPFFKVLKEIDPFLYKEYCV